MEDACTANSLRPSTPPGSPDLNPPPPPPPLQTQSDEGGGDDIPSDVATLRILFNEQRLQLKAQSSEIQRLRPQLTDAETERIVLAKRVGALTSELNSTRDAFHASLTASSAELDAMRLRRPVLMRSTHRSVRTTQPYFRPTYAGCLRRKSRCTRRSSCSVGRRMR